MYLCTLFMIVLLPEAPCSIILLFFLSSKSLKVHRYLVCFVILNGELVFDRRHLEASCTGWYKVLSHHLFCWLLLGIHWDLDVEFSRSCSLKTKLIWLVVNHINHMACLWLQIPWGSLISTWHPGLCRFLCFLFVLPCRLFLVYHFTEGAAPKWSWLYIRGSGLTLHLRPEFQGLVFCVSLRMRMKSLGFWDITTTVAHPSLCNLPC